MSDGSEKCPLTKMLWSVSIKTRTFASVNTCNGSKHVSCLKLLKKYCTIEQMCSDAHSITLREKVDWIIILILNFINFTTITKEVIQLIQKISPWHKCFPTFRYHILYICVGEWCRKACKLSNHCDHMTIEYANTTYQTLVTVVRG